MRHPSALLLCALLALPTPPVMAQSLSLPDLGDPSRQYISAGDERRLGQAVVARLRQQGLIAEDPLLGEYLNSVGQRLAVQAGRGDHPYSFFLVLEPSINAFAAPGGFIGIHSGLLLATRSESELAGVLAHEIAHVSQRHIARSIAAAKQMSLPMAAAMIASILLAAADGQAGQAALAGTMAYGSQQRIDFTRANEQEADRIGGQILDRSGFDPSGMADFFARLERLQGGFGAQIPAFLLTHPLPRERLADAQGRLENSGSREHGSSRDYYLARARLQALSAENVSALIERLETTLASGDYLDPAAERYAYALALKRAGRLDEAAAQIERLLAGDRDRLAYRIEAAELALARGREAEAWRRFEEARRLFGDDFALAMHYGQALATRGDPHQAMKVLQPHLSRRDDFPALFTVYAQAARRAGNPSATHAAMAEYFFLNGDLEQAINQAELGLRAAGVTPYRRALLEDRLQLFKAERQRREDL